MNPTTATKPCVWAASDTYSKTMKSSMPLPCLAKACNGFDVLCEYNPSNNASKKAPIVNKGE